MKIDRFLTETSTVEYIIMDKLYLNCTILEWTFRDMKNLKYVICLLLAMFIGIGSATAASIQFPSSIELKVGEEKDLQIQMVDLAITLKVNNSNSNVVSIPVEFAVKTDGPGSKTEKVTFTSDDATVFSTESEYNFKTTTVKVIVTDSSSSQGTSSGSNNNGSTSSATKDDVTPPNTGLVDYLVPVVIVNIVLIGAYIFFKKKSSFKNI